MWAGLMFDHPDCRVRSQSTLMLALVGSKAAPEDVHIDVPFLHPEDGGRGWDEAWYRVRPRGYRMKWVRSAEKRDDGWHWVGNARVTHHDDGEAGER
jgi:hypothetical protein